MAYRYSISIFHWIRTFTSVFVFYVVYDSLAAGTNESLISQFFLFFSIFVFFGLRAEGCEAFMRQTF